MVDIVAFCGAAGSGKDTAAHALDDYTQVRFAEPVYAGLLAMDPLIDFCRVNGAIYLSDITKEEGWDRAKEYTEVRRLLQKYGTEAGRDIHGQNCWVDICKKKIHQLLSEGKRVKVTDCRFTNEAMMLRNRGAAVIRIAGPSRREGVITSHSSEAGIPDEFVDYHIENNGTIEQLHKVVKWCASKGQRDKVLALSIGSQIDSALTPAF